MENKLIRQTEKLDMTKMSREEKILAFGRLFGKIYHRIEKLDHLNSKFGTDIEVTYAEIHLLDAIGKSEGAYVTLLAEQFEVTKGAVSQILMKLEEKAMIYKSQDPTNLSRKLIYLTELGKKAHKGHDKVHQCMNQFYRNLFEDVEEHLVDEMVVFMAKFKEAIHSEETSKLFSEM